MNNHSQQVPDLFLLAVSFEGGLGLLAVGLGWLLGDPPVDRIEWSLDSAGWGVLCALPLIGLVWLGLMVQWRPLLEILKILNESVVPLLRGSPLWKLAVISAFSGFGEELLFRGVLQNWVAGLFVTHVGPYFGLAVASAIFGLLHSVTAVYAVLAAFIGVYLGTLWLVFGNLLVPAVVHAVYNFWALVYLAQMRSDKAGQ